VTKASNKGTCAGDTLSFSAEGGVSFSWSGPAGFTSNSQFPFIVNAATTNSGTYYVKVISAKGCVAIDSTIASIGLTPSVNAGGDTAMCEGRSLQLNANGSNVTSWSWAPASAVSNATTPNPVVQPKQTTLYVVTATNNKCSASDSVLVVVNTNATADAGPDKVIIEGQSVILNGVAGGSNITYTWSPAENITGAQTLTPAVNPPVTKVYTLTVMSAECGIAADNVLVKVYKNLFVPNAFTPNNDGINDTWQVDALAAYPAADVKVFNRYGELVFYNHGINTPWDGKYKGALLPAGAYVYTIDLKNNSPLIKGVVFILR
jgi:gliding motility-associated-like protein